MSSEEPVIGLEFERSIKVVSRKECSRKWDTEHAKHMFH